jgi:lysophospholipid acyltransferase (LPLAT)-like uncharacterized protein
MLKSLFGSPIVQAVLGRGIGLYMLVVGWTTRWRKINQAATAPYMRRGGGGAIACVWHGRFMLAHKLWAYGRDATPMDMLVSRSRDGDVVALAARTVGVNVVRGSAAKGKQEKGGFEAARVLLRQMETGGAIAVTPDGPRGPCMRARMGPIQLAKMAQVPLLTLAWSTRWRLVMRSWDRMLAPLPFGRGVLVWGDPIAPPAPDADAAAMEACRLKLEAELNRVTAEADRLAGVTPINPAPLRADRAARRDEAAPAK